LDDPSSVAMVTSIGSGKARSHQKRYGDPTGKLFE
jgi:hypothetical protein